MELRNLLIDEKSRIIFDARMDYKVDKSLLNFYQHLKANHEKYSFREVDEILMRTGATQIYIWGYDDFSLYSYHALKDAGYAVRGLVNNTIVRKSVNVKQYTFEEVSEHLYNSIVVVFNRDILSIPMQLLNNRNVLIRFSHVVGRNGKQYFDFFLPKEKEYFLDAGSLDGETTRQFIDWCNGNYGAVYAFEANPLMTGMCKANLLKFVDSEKLFFYEVALWDKCKSVMFDNSGSKWDAHVDSSGKAVVKTNSIDNLLENRKVTFIKFDIEGSELMALHGAKQVIIKNKPRMAVSVYHNDDDLEKVMTFICDLNLGYRFALRHYHSDAIETILYVF